MSEPESRPGTLVYGKLVALRAEYPAWLVRYVGGRWVGERITADMSLTVRQDTAEQLRARMRFHEASLRQLDNHAHARVLNVEIPEPETDQ